MFQNHTDLGQGRQPGFGRKYCDNAGCFKRRVITSRHSANGVNWTNPAGCIPPTPTTKCWLPGQDPALDECCKAYNHTATIEPGPDDPPELQFYRLRPFYLGRSGRVIGHGTLYAPSPVQLTTSGHYGYLPLKCRTTHLKPGLAEACHGPHMYEEWFVGPRSGDPADMAGWRRPFARSTAIGIGRAVPTNAWIMAQPVDHGDTHVFVADGTVWQAPTFRIAGLYAPANGEFTTSEPVLMDRAILERLHLNAQASWHGRLIGGGCDEGCQAYVMVEIQDAATGDVLPGYEKERSLMVDVDGLRLPLRWNGTNTASWAMPKSVVFRIYFRDATIYSLGFD